MKKANETQHIVHKGGFKGKTPINAQRFYLREDMINKKIITKKAVINDQARNNIV